MVQSVDGKTLAGMLIHASACLNAEKQKINELNVFPVPDGDTGTNMSLTISTAAAPRHRGRARKPIPGRKMATAYNPPRTAPRAKRSRARGSPASRAEASSSR